MTLSLVWLNRPNADGSSKQFAILNLANFVYLEGIDETEEHPDGSKTRIWFQNGGVLDVEVPYRQMSSMIEESVTKSWTEPVKIREAERKRMLDGMRDVLGELVHH